MQCAHRNLCPVPTRQPRLDPTKSTDIEEHEIRYRSTKASISYTDIEGALVDKSSISVHSDIEVLNFDIDVSLISYCVDIEVPGFDIGSISNVTALDIDVSQSRAFDIECKNLRYRVVISYLISKVIFRPSISKIKPLIS